MAVVAVREKFKAGAGVNIMDAATLPIRTLYPSPEGLPGLTLLVKDCRGYV